MQNNPTLIWVVAAALFDGAGRVLMQRRPDGKAHAELWEFPGGKVEAAETLESALIREIEEELTIRLDPAALAPLSFAAIAGQPHVVLLYSCRQWHGSVACQEGGDAGWFTADQLDALDLPPLDRPLARVVQNVLNGRI